MYFFVLLRLQGAEWKWKDAKWNLDLADKIHEKLFDSDPRYDITQDIAVVTSSLAFLFLTLSIFLKVQSDNSEVFHKVMDKVKNSLTSKYDVPYRKQLEKEIEVYLLF